MALVMDASPAMGLEERLRSEATSRDMMMRSELQAMRVELRAEMKAELAQEKERRCKAEEAAAELAEQVRTLLANMPSRPDTLAKAPDAHRLTQDPVHMAMPSGEATCAHDKLLCERGNYKQVAHMSTESLEEMEFDHKDLTEDMWGIAVMLVTREVAETSERGFKGDCAIRICYATICVVLNLVLQLFLLKWVNEYIVGNSVWILQGQYAQFHREIFNDKGEFQDHSWMNWEGPRGELCDAVINKKLFLSGILFLWIGRMLGEFKTCQRMSREVWALPSAPTGAPSHSCVVDRAACPDVTEVIAMTPCTRIMVYLTVLVPKVCVCLLLAVLGCQWLTATLSFSDLILNALALEFIIGIDENILEFFLPVRIKTRLNGTKLAYPAKDKQTEEQVNKMAIDDYVRNITYFLVCIGLTCVYVLYFQQVLPGGGHDIEEHCGEWYMNQFSQKCFPFEKGCFPFGKGDPPHDYAEHGPVKLL